MTPRGAALAGLRFVTLAAALSLECHPPGPPLAVEFDGCTAFLVRGPVCVLDAERQLVLWVEKPRYATIEIRAGRQILPAQGVSVDTGLRFEVKLPKGTDRVEVRWKGESKRSPWSIDVSESLPAKPGDRDVLDEINRTTGSQVHHQIQEFRLREARTELDRLKRLFPESELPGVSRYLLAYNRGLLAAKEEDYREALTQLERAATLAERTGHWRNALFAREAIALRWSDLGRTLEASKVYQELAGTRGAWGSCEEGELLSNWAWASVLARESGGYPLAGMREPQPLLDQALEKLTAGPDCTPDLFYDVHFNRALAELQAHRPEQAARALEQARAYNEGSSFFQFLWALDLEGRLEIERGRPLLALEIYRRLDGHALAAGSPDGRLRAALGMARASAALGDRERALKQLQKAEELLDLETLRIPLYEGRDTFASQREGVASLEIELLLDAGRTAEALAAARRARRRFLGQLESAERVAALPPEARRRWNEAVKSYRDKRIEADKAARKEKGLLFPEIQPDRAAREVLADSGEHDLDQAFELLGPPVRREPAPPKPGELLLVYHPLPDGWVAFAAEGGRIATRRFELTPDLLVPEAAAQRALSAKILEPFRREIRRAERVRILPYGALRSLDFHALPLDGEVLLAAKPVAYGLDLSGPAAETLAQIPNVRQALLVADPNDDLRGARHEVDAAARGIGNWTPSWRVERLSSSAATAGAVRAGLLQAELFHFSGHGIFSGFGGWESGLQLADKSRLTVGELLVLRSVPRWVVLSGCETARTAAQPQIDGFGLANALILSGVRGVVASVRPVVDSTAPTLFAHLYDGWDGMSDLAVAFQKAQLAWRREIPGGDWQTFRFIEP